MNPWIIILFMGAGAVFAFDYLLRRKKWKDNSREEKLSLFVNMFSVGPYAFLSVLGILWGIVSNNPETVIGEVVYNATLMMGTVYFAVAAVACIVSLVLRKKGKVKASVWVNVIALAYIVIVLAVNHFAGKML